MTSGWRRALSGWRTIHWIFVGLAAVACALGVLAVAQLVSAFDTDRDLADFASAGEARAFVSAHLPVPLPSTALVEALHYERWTDWHLTARVRLPSLAASHGYVEQVRRERALDDQYCSAKEPSPGVRYFLAAEFACGSIDSGAAPILEVHCNTR